VETLSETCADPYANLTHWTHSLLFDYWRGDLVPAIWPLIKGPSEEKREGSLASKRANVELAK